MKSTVGLIGVGLMGKGIATNIVKHGYALHVMAHAGNQPLDDLIAAGVSVHSTPAQVARASEILILCLTGSPQVESVVTGPEGVMAGLARGATLVDCSTSLPTSTVRIAAIVQAAGGNFADAAMTRTPKHAMEGKLNLLVGADAATLAALRPLLATFSENITHCGPVGAGHRMKLLHNYVSLGFMSVLAEVGAHAKLAGIAPDVLIDVLAKGGGAGTALERMAPFLARADPAGILFSIGNAQKDLAYYCETAQDTGAVLAIADSVRRTLGKAVEQGHAQAYFPELAAILENQARHRSE